jgi:hypothetical protein
MPPQLKSVGNKKLFGIRKHIKAHVEVDDREDSMWFDVARPRNFFVSFKKAARSRGDRARRNRYTRSATVIYFPNGTNGATVGDIPRESASSAPRQSKERVARSA